MSNRENVDLFRKNILKSKFTSYEDPLSNIEVTIFKSQTLKPNPLLADTSK